MDVEEFLRSRGADLPATMAAIDDRFGLADHHVLLAVGSLVEGLGNSKSDLDLLLVASKEDGSESGPVTVVVGRCVIDVRVIPYAEVSQLLDRFEAWTRQQWALTRNAGFMNEEYTLLHRLRHGRPLFAGPAADIGERFPPVEELARLKLHAARQHSRTVQIDMAGNRDAGDMPSLFFAAQDLLGQAADALVAAYGLTNPVGKWRSRLLGMLPQDWESRLMVRPTGLSALDRVWQLHRAPSEPDERSVLPQAFAIATFSRAAFAWAESALLGWRPGAATATGSWHQAVPQRESPALPLLDFDVDFAPTSDGAVLARLNEFGDTLELSSLDFSTALLFDGETSESEAADALHDGDDAAVARLVATVREAGLCARAEVREPA